MRCPVLVIHGTDDRIRPHAIGERLAEHPVTEVLGPAGERIHPASAWLANESSHIDDDAGEHDLHVFETLRRLKRSAFAWLTDFVGWLPMPDGGAGEERLTAGYNLEMIEQRARLRRVRDRSEFVGNPDDVVPLPFGPGLPAIREWTEQNFDFSGYVTGFDPPDERERETPRRKIGVRPDEKLCVVTVGGSGVGESLLRRVLDAVPAARRLVPGLRFLVVTGPRIDPASLPRHHGVSIRGYLPDLHRHGRGDRARGRLSAG